MNAYWEEHALAQTITMTRKSLKTCYIFNTSRVRFKIVVEELK